MADGPQLPSVIQKIRVQPYLSIRQFPNHQAWTSSLQNLPSAGGYVIDRLHKTLLPAYAGSASYLASPLQPVFVGAPLEKHKSASPSRLLWVTFHVPFGVATAPIGRVKLMIQCQDEMIKSSRLPKPYKGIVNCFARTISNEGFISLWRGYIPSVISSLSFKKECGIICPQRSLIRLLMVCPQRGMDRLVVVNLHQLSSLNEHMVRTRGNGGGGPRRNFTSEGFITFGNLK